ncbi:uncharacterized protein IUM83_19415 [Phytophthora cinnamomi]|uniref:uncharacterized protein n=1 Tax=Phytophthora cinnamomi TaxID=4785 RepID=UPI00355A93AF|nr:hypothetical protein IUM83_19415 [Phytophthora cinnamomi]
MKRRTASKPASGDARARCGDVFSKIPRETKKLTKKKKAKSAASSILGLRKPHVKSTSEGGTRLSSDEGSAVDHVEECQRLRGQLERVLIDHQRQEEEIVALRALAKSLKDEVEEIQERQQLQSAGPCSSDLEMARGPQRIGSHELFNFDVQVEKLEGENAELRRQLEDSQEELQRARAYIAEKLPVYKLAAVKANAELRCVNSQLQQEREQSDRLQRQLVKCKARQDDVYVRVSPEHGNNQDEDDGSDNNQDSEVVRREREAFFQQCMRVQDSSENKQGSTTLSEIDDFGAVIETRKAQPTIFESSADVVGWVKSNAAVKPGKLIHEDLLGLDFYLDGMTLSPGKSLEFV